MAWFDYVVIEDLRYKKNQGYLVVALIILLIALFAVLNRFHSNVEDYKLKEGHVTDVRKTSGLRWNTPAVYMKSRKVKYNFVLVKIDNEEFILDERYADFWDKILSTLKKGDEVKLYYELSWSDDIIIGQFETEYEVLIPFKIMMKERIIAGGVILLLILSVVLFLIYLNARRRKFLKNPSLF